MRLISSTILFWIVALVWTPVAHTADLPIVVFDTRQGRIMAKNYCLDASDILPNVRNACLMDPTGGEPHFESKLTARFAIDPKCKGIKFITSEDERTQLIIAGTPYWELELSYVPGEQNQNWYLFDFRNMRRLRQALEGDGNEEKIASDVCAVVTEQGAVLK